MRKIKVYKIIKIFGRRIKIRVRMNSKIKNYCEKSIDDEYPGMKPGEGIWAYIQRTGQGQLYTGQMPEKL